MDLCDQKRQLKQRKYTSTEAGLEYRKVNREVKRKTKAAKEEWTEEQCKNTEKGMMLAKSKESYNTLKALIKTQQHKSAVIEDGNGNILTESTTVLNRLTEYCSGIETANSIQTLAYSRVTRAPVKNLKAYLCLGRRLKRLCAN